MLETKVEGTNAVMRAPHHEANSESPFVLSGLKQGKYTSLVVTYQPTNQRVFVDALILEAFRARVMFVKNLLDAVEQFTDTRLSEEQRRNVSAAVHQRLLRVTEQLDNYITSTSWLSDEPMDELNQPPFVR